MKEWIRQSVVTTRKCGWQFRGAVLALAAICASAPAQSFDYPDFANGGVGLQLLGDATTTAYGSLRLTANVASQSGWAWRSTPVQAEFGFTTTFTFRLLPSAFGTKGQGLVFVLHQDPAAASATGGTAWGLGYGQGGNGASGLQSALAIEIDTFQDVFLGDTGDNELSVHVRPPGAIEDWERELFAVARTTPNVLLTDGAVHTLRIDYDAGQFDLYFDGATQPELSFAYDVVAGGQYVSGGVAPGVAAPATGVTVGFCATTGVGTLTELAEVLSWQWRSTSPTHPCYEGSLSSDVLRVEQSTGGVFRDLRLGVSQSFEIGLSPPPTFGPGAPYVLFASLTDLAPPPGSPGTSLGFGEMCFPVLPMTASELVLADTFGLFPGVLSGSPAPHTFAIPPGLVNQPLSLTLQAVVAARAAPFELGVSNAIDVRFVSAPAPTIGTVVPASAPPASPIVLTGTGFLSGAQVEVAGVAVPTANVIVTETGITFPYPAGTPCDATLRVVNPDGQSAFGVLNPQIAIASTALASGPAAGGATFVVTGGRFSPGMVVTIGGVPATILSSTFAVIAVTTPPGTPGPQPVVVVSPGGCVATATYTYL
ncbi:MAG: IPT/TIG domain-containing protein [Planctomycetota bacterium]